MTAFKPNRKSGVHYSNLTKALRTIKGMKNLDIYGKDERKFEDRLAGALGLKFGKDLIDQRSKKQPMTSVPLFDHTHRPDMSIGTDGVAIEVKVITSGGSFREAIGQGLMYRVKYRFAIIIWIDPTKNKTYIEAINRRNSDEKKFLSFLEQQGVYYIIK